MGFIVINESIMNDWIKVCRYPKNIAKVTQTPRLCKRSLHDDVNWKNLKLIHNQTEEICRYAINIDPRAIQYVRDQTEDLCMLAVSKLGRVLGFIKNQFEEVIWAALKQDATNICYVVNPTEEMMWYALKKDIGSCEFFPLNKEMREYVIDYILEHGSIGEGLTSRLCLIDINSLTHEQMHAIMEKDEYQTLDYFIDRLTESEITEILRTHEYALDNIVSTVLSDEQYIAAFEAFPIHWPILPDHLRTQERFCIYMQVSSYIPNNVSHTWITEDFYHKVIDNVDIISKLPAHAITEEVAWKAIKYSIYNCNYVPNLTLEMKEYILKLDYFTIEKYLSTQDMHDLLRKDASNIYLFPKPTDEMIEYARSQGKVVGKYDFQTALKLVKKGHRVDISDFTLEEQTKLIKLNPDLIKQIRKPTPTMIQYQVEKYPSRFMYHNVNSQYAKNPKKYYKIALAAASEPWMLRYIKHQTEEIALKAVSKDGSVFMYSHYQTNKIVQAALANTSNPSDVLEWLD